MIRSGLGRTLAVVLAFGMLIPAVAGTSGVRADGVRQSVPPGINPTHPTVAGRLVAKATGNGAPSGQIVCGNSDRRGEAGAFMVNRGLVICTNSGHLDLLEISAGTGIFKRDWQQLTYGDLSIGDRLQAWGTLTPGRRVLNPTVAVRDLSKHAAQLQTVSGRLVAKPNAAPTGAVVCGDRDQTGGAAPLVNRGLVICTEEGRLILLQVAGSTRLLTHDRAGTTIEDLTLGDMLNATGKLGTGDVVMDPTVKVMDTNLQRGNTNSQDFVAQGGAVLTLFVLKSDRGPVEGMVHASPGEPMHIDFCGKPGTWNDLHQGLTLNISGSTFNTRTMVYVDTKVITVVNCR